MLNASTLVEGNDSDTLLPSYRSPRPLATSAISLWSAELRLSRPTSSKPDCFRPFSTMSPMVVMLRSRTGRVIMPAWQNRQPRVQPRKISTEYRSCTVSASGTSGFFGYGQASRSITVCLAVRHGTPGLFGATRLIRPSSR